MARDICKAFDRVWNADLLQKLVSYANSDQIFGFIFSLLSNRWLLMVLDGKSSQKYPVNGAIYADATVYSKCDQAYDLWQHLEFASEIESDRETLLTGPGNGLLISVLEKLKSFRLIGVLTLVLMM